MTIRYILVDYGELEIKLNPLHKSLYLLFLSHPEGIYFSKMEDYEKNYFTGIIGYLTEKYLKHLKKVLLIFVILWKILCTKN